MSLHGESDINSPLLATTTDQRINLNVLFGVPDDGEGVVRAAPGGRALTGLAGSENHFRLRGSANIAPFVTRERFALNRLYLQGAGQPRINLGPGAILNHIADPDICSRALAMVERLTNQIRRPCFNHATAVARTSRDGVARLLSGIVMSADTLTDQRWSEDLLSQARQAFAIGHALCTCKGKYHALWGGLRAANVSNSLKAEEPLLAALMGPFIRDGARVMIGGAADPGVPSVVGRIYAPNRPVMTVIDRCRAPLTSIRDFAAGKGIRCRTVHRDLLDLDGNEQWDQIVLHYTPDFVGPHCRARFFRALAQSLVSGGTLVCAAMTGTSVTGDLSQELADVYFNYSRKALDESPLSDLPSNPEFIPILRAYADAWGRRRANLITGEELRGSIIAAGLSILSESTFPRRKRFVGEAAIVDSNSFFVAGR